MSYRPAQPLASRYFAPSIAARLRVALMIGTLLDVVGGQQVGHRMSANCADAQEYVSKSPAGIFVARHKNADGVS